MKTKQKPFESQKQKTAKNGRLNEFYKPTGQKRTSNANTHGNVRASQKEMVLDESIGRDVFDFDLEYPSNSRKIREDWSSDEETQLVDGVRVFGKGNWSLILSHKKFKGYD
jgi:hypothetical protein